jgi:predicted cupin superfamily sugar epimerase/uncharacterized protein (DUF952 family)
MSDTTPGETAVFHICTRDALAAARATGAYRAESLVHEGFIHLSRAHQVVPTARAYFGGVADLVLLVIDPALLTSRLAFEAPAPLATPAGRTAKAPSSDLYPHCYGPIDLDAIVDVIDLARFDGTPVPAETMAMLRHYRFDRLPVEGTLYRSTWRSSVEHTNAERADGAPAGTAMIGLFAESPESVSCFHRLTFDEVWHAYAGDAFTLFLLHPDGRTDTVRMGTNGQAGEVVQFVVPAGVWQAGCLAPGGRFALFGCTMAPGFTAGCFEAGDAATLRAQYPAMAAQIERFAAHDGVTRMPSGFAE